MQSFLKSFSIIILLAISACAARADICAICGKPMYGPEYIVTDKVTGEQLLVCSNCVKLPRCFICGLPVKDGVELPDGRWLCARDAKTAVLNADDVKQTCAEVHDDLDHLFSRFTGFPTNVDVSVIDRIDVDSMFNTGGNAFESPDLLGYTQPVVIDNQRRYKIALLTGQPLAELKEVCAHELSHAWVGENVNRAQRGLGRDAEEGFCEMVGYLLLESQSEAAEEKRVLANRYTRGQVQLFIKAEKLYGFDQILDWMKYGVAAQLEPGHVDEIRYVKMPSRKSAAPSPFISNYNFKKLQPAPALTTIELQGIFWSAQPTAIINGHSFAAQDSAKIKIAGTNVPIRCLSIEPKQVVIQNLDSGRQQKLQMSAP